MSELDDFNRPIDYGYNVRIEGDELVFSLDERLISANVTVKLYAEQPGKHDPSHHQTIMAGEEIRIPLPAVAAASNNTKKDAAPAPKDRHRKTHQQP